MIMGNGDIASVLKDREDRLYFVSGVSNSAETRQSEYQREIDMLLKQDKTKHIVYVSSLCVFYLDSQYARHKRLMEDLIKENFKYYTIMRIGNITWGKNPHTIINYLTNRIKNGEPVEIRDEYRYIVDEDEFLYWINMIPPWSCEMNVTGKRMKIEEVVKTYVYPRIHSK